jgi:N-acetylneuraminate synthase
MKNKKIYINNKEISLDVPPYIIGEISANHNGSIENVYKLIDVAKKSGASAAKIQTYTADTITVDSRSKDFMIEGGLWDEETFMIYILKPRCHGAGINLYLNMQKKKI